MIFIFREDLVLESLNAMERRPALAAVKEGYFLIIDIVAQEKWNKERERVKAQILRQESATVWGMSKVKMTPIVIGALEVETEPCAGF